MSKRLARVCRAKPMSESRAWKIPAASRVQQVWKHQERQLRQ